MVLHLKYPFDKFTLFIFFLHREFYDKQIELPEGGMLRTPYGSRIEWKLPGENKLFVHLKDNTKIRNKKRWSQVHI